MSPARQRSREPKRTAWLVPLEPAHADLVESWLAVPDNHKWLDFGQGVQALNAVALRLMTQRPIHRLYLYPADDGTPAGIVGLSNVDTNFGTATLWYVLGDKNRGGGGLTTRAVRHALAAAFGPLGLRSVNAWAVERNIPSVRVLEKAGFRRIGVQRQCHVLDGVACDRVLFDVLPGEQAPP